MTDQMMIGERPEGYNIGWDIVNDRCISTAAISSSAPTIGYFMMYETIIWGWNGKERTNIIHQIHHIHGRIAEKVHGYIVNNMKNKIA